MTPPKLGILATHPVQYHAPLYRLLAQDPRIRLKVYFCDDHGVQPTFDRQFGRTVQFDVPLLDGYEHEFLRNLHPQPASTPTRLINPSIERVLRCGECDVLVVHGYNYLASALALLGPHGHTKLVVRGETNLLRPRSRATLVAKRLYLRALFSRADHFLAVGRLNREYYEAYGAPSERITLAPYTVDHALFASARTDDPEQRRALRRKFGVPEEGRLVLFVGKFMPLKRPMDIVRAVARLSHEHSVSLALVGTGELEGDVRSEIERDGLQHRVRMLGFLNQRELPSLYACADVLVLASNTETWGLVVNEAMAAGVVPIVTDQVGCGPDLVDPSCVYPVGDVDALTRVLKRMLDDQAWFSELRSAALTRIARWTVADTAEAFVQATLQLAPDASA